MGKSGGTGNAGQAPAQESEISGELVYSPYSKFHPKPLVDDLTIRVK